MPPRASATSILGALPRSVSDIFEQAQRSTANHRKNCIGLHKLHLRAACVTHGTNNGDSLKLTGERAFEDVFLDMVNRILIVKKGPPVADRIVKFIGAYVRHMNEKGESAIVSCIVLLLMLNTAFENKAADSAAPSTSAHIEPDDEDTPASRFVARLTKWLIRGFTSKNKNVRFRAVGVISEIVSHLGEIE